TRRLQVGEARIDHGEVVLQHARLRIVERHLVSGSREHDRPRAADEARSDHRDSRHQIVLCMSPHTESACPEMWRPAAVARKSAMSAMSCALTNVRSDVVARSASFCSSKLTPNAFALDAITRSMRSPSTLPGWMQF